MARLRDTVGIALGAMQSRLDLDLEKYANDYAQFGRCFPAMKNWWVALRELAVLTCKEGAEAFLREIPVSHSEADRQGEIREICSIARTVFDTVSEIAGLPVPEGDIEEGDWGRAVRASEKGITGDVELDRIVGPLLVEYRLGEYRYWALADPG